MSTSFSNSRSPVVRAEFPSPANHFIFGTGWFLQFLSESERAEWESDLGDLAQPPAQESPERELDDEARRLARLCRPGGRWLFNLLLAVLVALVAGISVQGCSPSAPFVRSHAWDEHDAERAPGGVSWNAWVRQIGDDWLAGRITALVETGDLLELALAVGMQARLKCSPAGVGGGQPFGPSEHCGVESERTWAHGLSRPSRRSLTESLRRYASESLHQASELDSTYEAPEEASRSIYIGLLRSRDDLRSVEWVLNEAGVDTSEIEELEVLDHAGRRLVAVLPEFSAPVFDPLLRRAWHASPNAWWTEPTRWGAEHLWITGIADLDGMGR